MSTVRENNKREICPNIVQSNEIVSAKRCQVATSQTFTSACNESEEKDKENTTGTSVDNFVFTGKHQVDSIPSLCPVYLTPTRMYLDQGCTSQGNVYVRLREPIVDDRPRKLVFNGEIGDWRLDDDAFVASFTLPNAKDKFDMLALRNPFSRDSRIVFIENTHDE